MLQLPALERTDVVSGTCRQPPRLAHVERGARGAGPAVVALHGLASARGSLSAAVLPLADHGLRVYVPDLLGHGASSSPVGDPYDIESHVAALRGWTAASVGAEPVWLVGYSIGALLAMAWAAREPERVRGVVAISAPLYLDERDARQTLIRGDLMARLMLVAPRLARLVNQALSGADGLGARLSRVRRFQRAYMWALVHGYGPRPAPGGEALAAPRDVEAGLLRGLEVCWLHCWDAMYLSLRRCIVEYRIWPDIERIRAHRIPLLFIHGDQDSIAPVERIRMAAALGHWPTIEYAGAAHSLALTHAPTLADALAGHFMGVN
ncbi:MAG TPA: alpha/beta fold hydrolase [Ktedonobacterales bacterium]